ncbi:hypothetical protein [Streptomyces sp. NPDC059850]|uniref:hypothetical protein n=1 Tax=Streptomyces sp. NPDC059850 TaxID=3346970 RepID=UPI00366727A2
MAPHDPKYYYRAVDEYLLSKDNDGFCPKQDWAHINNGKKISLGSLVKDCRMGNAPKWLTKEENLLNDFRSRRWCGEDATSRPTGSHAPIDPNAPRHPTYWKKVHEAATNFANLCKSWELDYIPPRDDKAFTNAHAEFPIGKWLEGCREQNGFPEGCPQELKDLVAEMGWMRQPVDQSAGQYAPQQDQAAANALSPQQAQHLAQQQVAHHAMLGSQNPAPPAVNPAGLDQSQIPAFGLPGRLINELAVDARYWQPPQPGQASRPPGQPGQGNTTSGQRRSSR